MDGRIAVQAITPVIHHAQTSDRDNHREQGNVSSNPCWQNRIELNNVHSWVQINDYLWFQDKVMTNCVKC